MIMKKKGASTLVFIILAVLIVVLLGITYYYTTKEEIVLTTEDQKTAEPEQKTVKPEQKTVELTPEELEKAKTIGLTEEEAKTAKSMDITSEEFKEVSTKANEYFEKERLPYGKEFLAYSKIEVEGMEGYKIYPDLKNFEIKPSSKIIRIEIAPMQPSPFIILLIEDGEVKIIAENLRSAPY